MSFLPFKGHRLVLADLERANNQHERDLLMRRVVRKGMRRFWFVVLSFIVDGVVIFRFGPEGVGVAFVCQVLAFTALYAVIDF